MQIHNFAQKDFDREMKYQRTNGKIERTNEKMDEWIREIKTIKKDVEKIPKIEENLK